VDTKEEAVSQSAPTQTRRDAIVVALAAAGGAVSLASNTSAAPQTPASVSPTSTGHEHDWDWEVGRWHIRHRQLKSRLTGSAEWIEFQGSCEHRLTLGGLGNVEDQVVERPDGTYRAMTIRTFDPIAGHWLIWWLDGRFPTRIEPPVAGGFKDGIGLFIGDDTLRGQPIKVRFEWSRITPDSAHWEQAFSPDGGETWETNWRMDFTREPS
jgi:hypothetical protein